MLDFRFEELTSHLSRISFSAVLIAEFTLDIRECESESADGHLDSRILSAIAFPSLSNNASLIVE